MTEKLQIFLADDHVVVREGLKALINAQPDMIVIGEAGDGQTAWQQARECHPDVVIMDITMPELNGVQATAQLKRACPTIKILALSVHDDTSYLRQLLAAGAAGYILKHAAADDLIQAIRLVAAGGVYLNPALAGHVVACHHHHARHPYTVRETTDTTCGVSLLPHPLPYGYTGSNATAVRAMCSAL